MHCLYGLWFWFMAYLYFIYILYLSSTSPYRGLDTFFIKENLLLSAGRDFLNDFKKECKDLFKNNTNLPLEVLLERLNKLIRKYNKNRNFNNKFLNFMRHYINKLC